MSCGKGSPRDRYVSRHLSKTRRSVSLLGNVPGLLAAWLVSPATDDLSSVATDEDTLGSGVAVEAPAPLLASPKKKSVASPNSVLACSARTNGNPPPGGSGMLRFGFSSEPRPWLLLLLRDFCRTLAAAPAGMYATRGRPDRIRVWGVWGGVLVSGIFLIKTHVQTIPILLQNTKFAQCPHISTPMPVFFALLGPKAKDATYLPPEGRRSRCAWLAARAVPRRETCAGGAARGECPGSHC